MKAVHVLLVILVVLVDLGDGGLGEITRIPPPAPGKTVTDAAKVTSAGKIGPIPLGLAALVRFISLQIKNLPIQTPITVVRQIIAACHVSSSGGLPW